MHSLFPQTAVSTSSLRFPLLPRMSFWQPQENVPELVTFSVCNCNNSDSIMVTVIAIVLKQHDSKVFQSGRVPLTQNNTSCGCIAFWTIKASVSEETGHLCLLYGGFLIVSLMLVQMLHICTTNICNVQHLRWANVGAKCLEKNNLDRRPYHLCFRLIKHFICSNSIVAVWEISLDN